MNRPGWSKATVGCYWYHVDNRFYDWTIATVSTADYRGYVVYRNITKERFFPTWAEAAEYVESQSKV